MANRTANNLKLGIFVMGGLLFLVFLLYMIGKNRNMFGNTYVLKARFENVQGLVAGNNVRFSGISAGTVKKVKILSDTLIEVTMIIETKMKDIIRKNAMVSIGTDGLVGNKVVNISPSKVPSPLASEGDILASKKAVDTDEMLQTLNKTNKDVAIIADGLKLTVQRLNNSSALWSLFNDNSIPGELRKSLGNIRLATTEAGSMIIDLHAVVTDIRDGKGSIGTLLTDTSLVHNLDEAILTIKKVGDDAITLVAEINKVVAGIQNDINSGKGTANTLLKDSLMVIKLNASLDNIQKGTDGFNQNMEALKSNFLFRGYFRKLERQKKK